MALKKWRGGAQGAGQVTRVTFSAYTSGQTYTLTINGKSISYVATASTITNVVDGLVAAWQASPEREFAEAIPTNSSGVLLTSVVAGTPFTVTGSATGGITATVTLVTAASGPNHFTTAQNWVGGVAPVAGDDLLFADTDQSLLYALEDVSNNYGNITIDSSFVGAIGLPPTNSNGYQEYRPRFLKLGDGTSAFAVTIGLGTGRQPERVLIDANNASVTAAIYGTGSNSADSDYPVVIKNPDNASVINLYAGRLQVDADSSGACSAVRVTPSGQSQDASLLLGANIAAGDVLLAGGAVELRGSATTLVASDGATVEAMLGFTCPTITVASGAELRWRSTAGIATRLTVQHGGRVDFSGQGGSKTVAACDLYATGSISDPLAVVTWTAGIAIKGCTIGDVTLDLGRGRTLQVS